MAVKSIVIWGAGQHARTAADVAWAGRNLSIAGFIDDINTHRYGTEFCGARILGGRDALESIRNKGIRHIFVALGDNRLRLEFYRHATEVDFEPVSLIHPFTSIATDNLIGTGSIVRAGAVLEADVDVGPGVIIGANATLTHGCRVEQGARIAAGSTLSGNVHMKRCSRVGPGSTLLNRVCVGEGALLGAGAVLTRDLPAYKVAMGCPAKVVRDVTDDDF